MIDRALNLPLYFGHGKNVFKVYWASFIYYVHKFFRKANYNYDNYFYY